MKIMTKDNKSKFKKKKKKKKENRNKVIDHFPSLFLLRSGASGWLLRLQVSLSCSHWLNDILF